MRKVGRGQPLGQPAEFRPIVYGCAHRESGFIFGLHTRSAAIHARNSSADDLPGPWSGATQPGIEQNLRRMRRRPQPGKSNPNAAEFRELRTPGVGRERIAAISSERPTPASSPGRSYKPVVASARESQRIVRCTSDLPGSWCGRRLLCRSDSPPSPGKSK